MQDDIYVHPTMTWKDLHDSLKQEIRNESDLQNRRVALERQRIDAVDATIKKGLSKDLAPLVLGTVVGAATKLPLGGPIGSLAGYAASKYLGSGVQDLMRLAPRPYALDPMIRSSQQRQQMIKQGLKAIEKRQNEPYRHSYTGMRYF